MVGPPTIPTFVIESNHMLREGLISFVANSSFEIITSVTSVEEFIEFAADSEARTSLVILGGGITSEEAGRRAARIRAAQTETKIVLLAAPTQAALFDLNRVREVDGCIAYMVSRKVLLESLMLIAAHNVRVVVVPELTHEERSVPKSLSNLMLGHVLSNSDLPAKNPISQIAVGLSTASINSHAASRNTRAFGLSDRESQILDMVVKGQTNKAIANTCAVSEATVKVHLKSILRKIQVSNRTQAAIWALSHGFVHEADTDVKALSSAMDRPSFS